ncbi:hypothetical protein GCM10010425_13960 [Streptomyces spororaveus]|uniref:Uncharacterized protein n=1 Tax=Streptomyces spororaveus TaxID=284039 RepID=A0ABQ3T597_9ACTN|nr:hypothetical protein [Streptomyces spororaveus]GHI75547.1 hypothetical protein Sspor_11080 [Streptomyces spororaveus]
MTTPVKRMLVGASAVASALVIGLAGTASAAAIGFNQTSTSGKAEISGTYEYHVSGTIPQTKEKLYAGSFKGATAKDKVAGDGYEAVLALSYQDWKGGAWHSVKNHVAVVNGSKSWTFKDKKDVKAYACDRKVGTAKLLNCRAAW